MKKEEGKLHTKYPILLIHGMGFREYRHINYWGRIPAMLKKHGAVIYYGLQDCNGSVESNALQIQQEIDRIFETDKPEKLNIIAHSKGGLEARYIISTLGYADKIASLTTLSTPHHGSLTVDALMHFPDGLIRFGCKVFDLGYRITGDKTPDTYKAICTFRTAYMKEFNRANPDKEGILYRSYSFVMSSAFSDLWLWLTHLVVKHYEGMNDGLLAPRATHWTGYQGIYRGVSGAGISHCDEVDMYRRNFKRRNQKSKNQEKMSSKETVIVEGPNGEKIETSLHNIDDIRKLYFRIVKELKDRGL